MASVLDGLLVIALTLWVWMLVSLLVDRCARKKFRTCMHSSLHGALCLAVVLPNLEDHPRNPPRCSPRTHPLTLMQSQVRGGLGETTAYQPCGRTGGVLEVMHTAQHKCTKCTKKKTWRQ